MGSRSDANNYRPTSVISVFSRILERIVHDQMYDYLRSRDILTISQSAFQKLCSTVTSLIDSMEFWYENIDLRKVNLAIFLDLKKAFDTVNHEILLEKLKACEIRELAGNWFRSYLEGRQQYCKLVTCGIPQGSCLGPLLFIVYLNDFEKCLKASKAVMYADDCQVSLASSSVDELVRKTQDELSNISEWIRPGGEGGGGIVPRERNLRDHLSLVNF